MTSLSHEALRDWIRVNRPDLDAKLADLPMLEALKVLNEATGLDIKPTAAVGQSCAQFLERLRGQT
jgi:hypothetical protein